MIELGEGENVHNKLKAEVGRVRTHLFHILKNVRFAYSLINLLYLGHGTLNNIPTSLRARKEN